MNQEFEIVADETPAIIGARGLEDVMQCIRYIVRTTVFSVPLDRGFAHDGSFIDAPLPHAAAARIATLTEAIERREPRVRVSSQPTNMVAKTLPTRDRAGPRRPMDVANSPVDWAA